MRVKLTVVHAERGGEPRTYVLEQENVVIGRAGTCEIPLDDPDLVVSKRHAELRIEADAVRVFDMGSKNHTFVNGVRVGTAGTKVDTGDQIQLGPFQVAVEVDRSRLVADDLDRTVFGAAFANPFAEAAEAVAAAIGGLRSSFHDLDYGHRTDALRDALRDAMGPGPAAQAVASLVAPASETPASEMPAFAPPPPPASGGFDALADLDDDLFGAPVPPAETPSATSPNRARPLGAPPDPFAAPPTGAPQAGGARPDACAAPDGLHRALAAVVARLISIPGRFRHEFLGHTVIHAPETAFLFDADVDALLQHLAPRDPAVRAERLAILDDAAEAVLQHHQSLLEGYRAAARDGAAVLVNGLDPDVIGDQAVGGGLLQGRDHAVLDLVRERCALMRAEDFAAAERRIYRPAFSRAYLDSLAHARSVHSPSDP